MLAAVISVVASSIVISLTSTAANSVMIFLHEWCRQLGRDLSSRVVAPTCRATSSHQLVAPRLLANWSRHVFSPTGFQKFTLRERSSDACHTSSTGSMGYAESPEQASTRIPAMSVSSVLEETLPGLSQRPRRQYSTHIPTTQYPVSPQNGGFLALVLGWVPGLTS